MLVDSLVDIEITNDEGFKTLVVKKDHVQPRDA